MTLGNPLFVRELARSYRATGELTRSVTIDTIIATNLERLGPDATASMQVAGLLGERFRAATVAAVIGAPGTSTPRPPHAGVPEPAGRR